jgi:hypothetical protein
LHEIPAGSVELLPANAQNQAFELLAIHIRIADRCSDTLVIDDGGEQLQHPRPLVECGLFARQPECGFSIRTRDGD